jgi:hypothetical protein
MRLRRQSPLSTREATGPVGAASTPNDPSIAVTTVSDLIQLLPSSQARRRLISWAHLGPSRVAREKYNWQFSLVQVMNSTKRCGMAVCLPRLPRDRRDPVVEPYRGVRSNPARPNLGMYKKPKTCDKGIERTFDDAGVGYECFETLDSLGPNAPETNRFRRLMEHDTDGSGGSSSWRPQTRSACSMPRRPMRRARVRRSFLSKEVRLLRWSSTF